MPTALVTRAGATVVDAWTTAPLREAGDRAVAQSPSMVRQTARVDISARVDYAVRAMLTSRRRTRRVGPISIDILSTRQELPRKFLEAIFADLRRGSLVLSVAGRSVATSWVAPRGDQRGRHLPCGRRSTRRVRGLRPHETEYGGVATHLPSLWWQSA